MLGCAILFLMKRAALILMFIFIFSSAFPNSVSANISGAASKGLGALSKSPYGGLVLMMNPCTCIADGSIGRKYLLVIGPPHPGVYVVDLLTAAQKPYLYAMWIIPTVWHKGWRQQALPTDCMMQAYPVCIPHPFMYQPLIYKHSESGTSLPGGMYGI
jgi:hypothetical protein